MADVEQTIAGTIETTAELAAADFEEIQYAKIRLAKGERVRYDGGRIVGRYQNDLVLRYRGHEVTVNNILEWRLVQYIPVRSPIERQMIEDEWGIEA